MAHRPLYGAVSLGILTIGLTATITTFAYLNSFGQGIPGAESGGLVEIWGADRETPYQRTSFLDYESYADEARGLEALTAVVHGYMASVRHEELTEVAVLSAVSDRYFDVLGVDAALGRGFVPGDDRLSADPAAVISHDWWVERFQRDPGVVGRTLYLNYRPFTIVGVMEEGFIGVAAEVRPRAWIPISHFRDRYTGWDLAARNRDLPLVRVFARLEAGSTRPEANQELARIAANLDQAFPRGEGGERQVRVASPTWIDPRAELQEASTNRVMVLAVAGFLLLVCANVANLLLALYAGQKRAYALRVALGASPGRVLREILAQNLLLAGLAAVMATLLAGPLSRRMGSFFDAPSVWGENLTRPINVDGHVVAFALLAAAVTGILAALLPASEVARRDAAEILKSENASKPGALRVMGLRLPGTRDLLVMGQVALAVVLLVVSALVVRTFAAASAVDPGFDYDQMVAAPISTSSTNLRPEERESFLHDLVRALEGEPWVRSATMAQTALLAGHRSMTFYAEGGDEPVTVATDPVHVGFFEKVGLVLDEGRAFTAADSARGRPVVIVNREAAARFFPTENPIGRRLTVGSGDGTEATYDVVGVVGNVRMSDLLAPPDAAIFLPFAQSPYGTSTALHVRVRNDVDQAAATLHRWLREFEPHLAIINTIPYRKVIAGQLYSQRMNAELFTILAIL
ncbi:MAG: FtsX-like permease family protein, partial [Gemmatimonadetes bacterium]|nr:FtsX-like permease family protein [Gemmatimonadota bacterium]